MPSPPNWSPTQLVRLQSGNVPRCVDVHCHVLPGLDDGPPTLVDALDLCDALVDDGVTTVIATPHQLGAYDGVNTAAHIRASVRKFAAELAREEIPLEIFPGADVRVDERLARLLDDDRVLTVADRRRHLLLELPHELFVDPLPAITSLQERGIQVIMTHPERHRYLHGATAPIAAWVAAGAVLQITAGSLLGDFGPHANENAWRLVHAGLVSLIATDAHDSQRRPPQLSAALDVLITEVGFETARILCLENPWRVFQGESLTASSID
jgi:protein-tyrosine phosphatase